MIDKIGDYSDEIKVSKSAVVKDFDGHFWLNGQIVSYERMTARFDQFVANMDFGKYSDKEYIIFLPPYSVVYWHAAKERGYYDTLQRFVSYMLDNTKDYPNVRFVCMYDADFVTELDTYSDMLHYGTTRKGSITDAILGITDYNISPNNVDYRLQHLDSMLSAFEKTDWRN